MKHRSLSFLVTALWLFASGPLLRAQLPSLEEVVLAGRDLWGEAAMAEPNGPSYEFFRDLLPPPRYVHADYRYYPIVLSAPQADVKSSLISNGSGLNLRGGARSWKDNGTPVTFRVGPDEFLFGGLRERVSEPALADGYLPIVEINYLHPSPVQSEGAVPLIQQKAEQPAEIYRVEAFASTGADWRDNCLVFCRFGLSQGTKGRIAVQLDDGARLLFEQGAVRNSDGQVLAVFDSNWKWERNRAYANLSSTHSVTAVFPTKPLAASSELSCSSETYDRQRAACAQTWREMLSGLMHVETPETLVNNAWKNLLIQNFSIMRGDRIHYSALNQYDALYETEGSDAAVAMLLWGCDNQFRKMLEPLFDYRRKGLEYHNAGTKLLNICRYFWLTRDASVMSELRERWDRELALLVDNRTAINGLYPKERYCGDISTQVHSINVNAKAWRAMRDVATVLSAVGEDSSSQRIANLANEFRQTVLTAIEQSVRRETSPPFVPVALLDQEPAHKPITHVRIGSYWNIIIGYTIASGIFPIGSEQENWIPNYQESYGGLCMGMVRAGGAEFNFWSGEHRVNPLYSTRYALDALRRDQPERALVSFYGMLAQGLTRNTFVGGEGCTLEPVDSGGRFFYCPPNTAANGHVLSMLRNLLVQDLDANDDGRPEQLRLMFGTPRRWLEEGKSIRVLRAPTAWGPLSLLVQSELESGRLIVELDLPARDPIDRTLLRLRVPQGWQVVGAICAGQQLPVDPLGTIDVSRFAGKNTIIAHVVPLRR